MAEIDKTYYCGTDAYSDGDEAENTLLQIVRDGKDIEALAEVSWPTLYHLSPVRENICNWYPFAPGSRVLEVGAGCGAITGALCGKGLDIYSTDLSLRRSTINFERHKGCPELHLVVGNLNDMSFSEPFDYVLLFGVLEYAGRFTGGEDPYRSFLEHIRGFLKPDGKLLVAIENRFGFKYFAGAPEDHLGEAFVGLRGYDPQAGIQTFSKSELTNLLEQSGFRGHRFYYPYPDYKFPLEIFTDETLISQHYGKPFQIFDRDFVELFPMAEVASVLAEDGAAAALANSFLVEATLDERFLDPNHVFYAKLNSGRHEAFRIGTSIIGTDVPSHACKYALNAAALRHIDWMVENEEKLSATKHVLVGRREGSGIVYPYRSEITLEDILREGAMHGEAQKIIEVFEKIKKLALIEKVDAAETPAFGQWFGDQRLSQPSEEYTSPANVDLMPDNIFLEGGEPVLIDCEWVADFPVPVGFTVWRSIESAWLRIPALERVVSKETLCQKLGIRPEDIEVFRAWSWHFENVFVSSGVTDRFAKEVRPATCTPIQAEQMKQEIRNRDGHIEQLLQSERDLKGENARLLQSERDLKESERELKESERELKESERKLKESESELKESERELKEEITRLLQSERGLKDELFAIHNSPIWPLMRLYQYLQKRVRMIKEQREKRRT